MQKNMEQKVSIIIPAYNCEEMIEKCLNSLLQQTYKNIEIFVINDGSQDNTEKVLEKYKALDERIIVIHKENSGVSDTRNLGIKKSTGSYISFIDSDDWVENNMIEEMVKALEMHDVDFVRCNHFKNSNEGSQKIETLYELANKKYSNKEIYEQHVAEHFLFHEKAITNFVMLLLVKREFLIENSIYFDKELYMLEDAYFYQKLFKNAQSVYFLDKPLYHYFENEKSITRSPEKFAKVIYGIMNANTVITRYLIENHLSSIELEKLNANYIYNICIYLNYICACQNKATFIELIQELKQNGEYNRMLNNMNYSNFKLKHKIQIRVILFKNDNMKYFFMKGLSIMWQIKNKKRRT